MSLQIARVCTIIIQNLIKALFSSIISFGEKKMILLYCEVSFNL